MNRLFEKMFFGEADKTKRFEQMELLASLVENSSDAIFSRNLDRKITSWNKGAEIMFGYSGEEVMGKSVLELHLFDLTDARMNVVEEQLFQHNKYTTERTAFRKNGSSFFASVTMNTVRNEAGDVFAFGVVIKDVSQKKELEEKLSKYNEELEETVRIKTEESYKREKRFRTLLENNSDIIALMDGAMNIIYRSPSAYRITGWTKEELATATGGALVHPDDLAVYQEAGKSAMINPGKPVSCAFRSRHKDGRYLYFEGILVNMLDVEDVNAILFNFRDVTERKQAEIELKKGEENSRNLLERISDGFIAFDNDFNFVYANAVAEKMFNREPGYLIGKNFLKEFPTAADSKITRAAYSSMKTQKPNFVEDFSASTGRWVQGSIYPSTAGLVIYFRDITEQVIAQDGLRKSEEKYRSVVERISDAFLAYDADFNFVYLNKVAGEILSRRPEDLIGKNFLEEFPEAKDSPLIKAFYTAMEKQQPIFMEAYSPITKRWLQTSIYPSREGVSYFSRDITEKITAATELKKSEEKYHRLLENISDAFIAMDNNWSFTYLNTAAEKMFRRAPGYLIGKNFKHEYPEAVNAPISKAYLEAISTQKPVFIDTFSFATDTMVQVSLYPSPEGVAFYFKDITSRMLSEKALQQSEEKYRTLVERTSDGLISLNEQWNFVYANKAAVQMFAGVTDDGDLMGKNVWELFPSAIGGPFYNAYHKAMETQHEAHLKGYSTGTGLWLEASIYPSPTGLTILFRDITEQVKAEEEMWKMEEKYRTLVERITDAFISLDNNWNITYLNKQAGKLIGKNMNDLLGKNMFEVFPLLKMTHNFSAYNEAMTKQHYVSNVTYYAPTGVWMENHIYPSANGLSLVVRDITTKIKADRALKRSEETRARIMGAALDAIVCIDLSETIILWNAQAESLFGWKDTEVLGKQISETIIPASYSHRHAEGFKKYNKSGHGDMLNKLTEVSAKNKNGIEFPIEIFIVPVRQESGDFFCAFIRDISERKKADAEMIQQQKRLSQAQAIAHVGHWEVDFATNMSVWSDEAYRIYGIEPGDHKILMEEWFSYIHPDDLEYVTKKIDHATSAAKDFELEHRIIAKDGQTKYLYTEARFEFDKDKKPCGLYGVTHDVTETVLLEMELQEQQRIEQLKLTATALEAQEKERNAISLELHDNVNQILVGTKMLLSMMKKDPVKHADYLQTSMNNLQQAIDENRKIAHELAAPDFSIASLTERMLELTDKMLRSAGLDVHVNINSFNEDLLSTPQLLAVYRIVQEQCTNIVKHAKANLVNILLSTTPSHFHMIISDDGAGTENQNSISGTGLTNIRSRVSVFSGTTSVVTARGKGFILEINMPLYAKPIR